MWEAFKEEYVLELIDTSITLHKDGVRREDGTTVMCVAQEYSGWRTFVLKTPQGGGVFYAERWNDFGETPRDNYVVRVRTYTRRWEEEWGVKNKEENQRFVLAHAKDIESALLHFPLTRTDENIPVKTVWFQISDVTDPLEKRVKADEVVTV
jgi:hypothetical protein